MINTAQLSCPLSSLVSTQQPGKQGVAHRCNLAVLSAQACVSTALYISLAQGHKHRCCKASKHQHVPELTSPV